jgi:hypothetical protein
LAAGKSEKLLGQSGVAVCRTQRGLNQTRHALVVSLERYHFQATDNGGQQVVEVVSDAAGELGNRLHLLRLSQLLHAQALGGFAQHADGADQDARLVVKRVKSASYTTSAARAAEKNLKSRISALRPASAWRHARPTG